MKTIAWDIDDVLNELMRSWLEKKWVIEHSDCCKDFSQITENPPHKLLGISKQEYLASLDEFRSSDQYKNLRPIPAVKNWFLDYGKFFRHIAVTSVPIHAAYASAEWLLRNFGAWIRLFYFVPSTRRGSIVPCYDRNKKDFLNWLGKADIFIDDNEANIDGCKKLKIKAILFPRPWNSSKLSITETLERLTADLK